MPVERDRALGDVGGEIADALEFDADAQRRKHLAQIARDRLAQRQHAHRARVEVAFQRIDLEIALDHVRGDGGVAQQQRVDRAGELGLRQLAHARDRVVELGQFLVETFHDVVGHGSVRPESAGALLAQG